MIGWERYRPFLRLIDEPKDELLNATKLQESRTKSAKILRNRCPRILPSNKQILVTARFGQNNQDPCSYDGSGRGWWVHLSVTALITASQTNEFIWQSGVSLICHRNACHSSGENGFAKSNAVCPFSRENKSKYESSFRRLDVKKRKQYFDRPTEGPRRNRTDRGWATSDETSSLSQMLSVQMEYESH
jgi:hypothetical protein